jgi:hypothetical protein
MGGSAFQDKIYDPVCLVFQILGIIATFVLLRLIKGSKYDNLFNNCIWHMSVGLGIFNLFSPLMLFIKPAPWNFWIQILRHGASVWSYMVSSLLSYSVYYLALNKHQLDFSKTEKNKSTQLIFGLLLAVVMIVYLALGFTQLYFLPYDAVMVDHDLFVIFATAVKMICSVYNLVNFFYCECIIGRSMDPNSFQYLAISVLMKRIKIYPIIQFISQIFYFVGGFTTQDDWINLDAPNLSVLKNGSPGSQGFLLFTAALLYLDIAGILIAYILLHPNTSKQLKRQICCQSVGDIVDASGTENSTENNNSNNRRSSIFSRYKPSQGNYILHNSSVISSASTVKVRETVPICMRDTANGRQTVGSEYNSFSFHSKDQLELMSDSELSDIVEKLWNSGSGSQNSYASDFPDGRKSADNSEGLGRKSAHSGGTGGQPDGSFNPMSSL